MLIEIRCCCNADNILGYMDLPESHIVDNAVHTFVVMSPAGHDPLKPTPIDWPMSLTFQLGKVMLDISPEGRWYRLALKSRDYPEAQVRAIKGFISFEERVKYINAGFPHTKSQLETPADPVAWAELFRIQAEEHRKAYLEMRNADGL